MELNAEQIIKALECVGGRFVKCSECAYYREYRLFPECRELAGKHALALIKQLYSQYMSENHLRQQVEEMLANGMDAVKADTVKKLRKKLHSEAFAIFDDEGRFDCYAVDLNDIDRILKEVIDK